MKIAVRVAKDGNSLIIMIGNLQMAIMENKYNELMKFIDSHYNYVVKHCDNENIPTHIDRSGFVNRYGILVSKTEIDFNNSNYIDFPKGKYKKETCISFEQLVDMLN